MTASLTPRERVEAAVKPGNLIYSLPQPTVSSGDFVDAAVARQLVAELEEANERAQKWAEDAGHYAANADFWRKRVEAAEQERDAVHAGEIAAMEGCEDIPLYCTPNGRLAWLVGSYKNKLEAAERQLAEKNARIAELEASLSQPKAKWETVGEGVVLPDFDAL